MSKRKKIKAADLYPDHDITIEPEADSQGNQPAPPKQPRAPEPEAEPNPRATFVSLGELYNQRDDAEKRGWNDKARDIEGAIADRLKDQHRKDVTINEILAEARSQRRAVHPFIVTVGACEELTLVHLDIGLRLNGLLDGVPMVGSNWRDPGAAIVASHSKVANRAVYSKHKHKRKQDPVKTFEPKVSKSIRRGGDGGMAARVDRLRETEGIWPTFLAITESEGERLTGKAGFSQVCAAVIRGDSGIETAIKGRVRGKISVLREAARSSMVAGLDAVAPMFARKR